MNRASRTAGVPSPECATATAAVTGPGSEGTCVGVGVHGVSDGGGGSSSEVVVVVEKMVMVVHEHALSRAHQLYELVFDGRPEEESERFMDACALKECTHCTKHKPVMTDRPCCRLDPTLIVATRCAVHAGTTITTRDALRECTAIDHKRNVCGVSGIAPVVHHFEC